MKGSQDKCIAILSSSANHRTEFIQIYNDISHTASNFEFGTELIEYDTNNLSVRKPDGVIILFDLYSRDSYDKACQLSTQVKVHKLLLGINMPPAVREVTFDEANEKAVEHNCFYHEIDITATNTIKESISFLLNRINELEFGSKYRFKIPISLRGKSILKNLSILVTLLTGVSGLAVLIIGAITSLLVNFEGTWLGDSLIYSGCLTFMVCFLGFYGTRIENIREYLKIVRNI
jgi:VIT1/CCC1 family predicted Fe2+/Mn2+ transporter